MDSPDIPPPPDPNVVAAAQTKSNKETAIANAELNRVDQYGPQGSTTYQITGYNADGTPKYSQTNAYSAGEQGIYDNSVAARTGAGNAAATLGGTLNDTYSQPFKVDQSIADNLTALGRQRLDPQYQQEGDALRTQLINQGIQPGTDAYEREMTRLGQSKNDAYNSLYLNGQNQAYQQSLTNYQTPLNTYNSLMTGSQVQNPTFGAVPTATQANTDVAGITQNAYNQQLQAFKMQNDQSNAFNGGLFGLGAAALQAVPWSDRRLKKDIKRIGTTDAGLPIYTYSYIWGGPVQMGVMAQEAEELFPDAVHDFNGLKAVDYGKVG